MSEFKFSCPSCSQNIKVPAEMESRRIDCPSCKKALIVPAPPKVHGHLPAATLAQPAARPKPGMPTKPAPAVHAPRSKPSAPKPAAPAPEDASGRPVKPAHPAPATKVPIISEERVAVLTPKLKLEIVRAIRPRLADKARWLPGRKAAGQYNYAARREGDQLIPVSPTDASATHLSLFGAVLLEFHQRNVMNVTTGRHKFLEEELTAAIRQALGRPADGTALREADRKALTHEQCLAVLDILEERYQRDAEVAKKKEEKRKVEHVRLADLVKKMEKRTPVLAEEVACALFYEVEELNQRLDKLERKADPGE